MKEVLEFWRLAKFHNITKANPQQGRLIQKHHLHETFCANTPPIKEPTPLAKVQTKLVRLR
jgi:hypothetical protein